MATPGLVDSAISKSSNPNVRWTLAFLHKPLWTAPDLEKNGWAEMEKNLAGRKYTVFCGHVHRYQKFVRNGMNYYQLATTGGGSRLRGLPYGEFDRCRATLDFTPLEPGNVEHKFYAPGVGLVLEVDPASGERLELVSVTTE